MREWVKIRYFIWVIITIGYTISFGELFERVWIKEYGLQVAADMFQAVIIVYFGIVYYIENKL